MHWSKPEKISTINGVKKKQNLISIIYSILKVMNISLKEFFEEIY